MTTESNEFRKQLAALGAKPKPTKDIITNPVTGGRELAMECIRCGDHLFTDDHHLIIEGAGGSKARPACTTCALEEESGGTSRTTLAAGFK